MTNELEKQFFETFGIEPKYESHSCDGWGRTVEVKYFTDKKEADKFGIVVSELEYTQITDRIYLELHCLLNSLDAPPYGLTVKEFKKDILISAIGVLSRNETAERIDNIKHQVRTLFEEG